LIAADYVVLATGSAYPYPAKVAIGCTTLARQCLTATHQELARAEDVLLLGAGAVGLELAGEIKAAWPEKSVTIVDPAYDILSGQYAPEFRAELRRQLGQLGVNLLLGSSLRSQPPSDAGRAGRFTVSLGSGSRLDADIWFRCFGVEPVSDYLGDGLAATRQAGGHLQVEPDLRLAG